MIDVHQTRADTARHFWSGTLQRLFEGLGLADRTVAPEISESLAVFYQEHPRQSEHSLSLFGHIRDVLAQCTRKNGWDQRPSVLQIDL